MLGGNSIDVPCICPYNHKPLAVHGSPIRFESVSGVSTCWHICGYLEGLNQADEASDLPLSVSLSPVLGPAHQWSSQPQGPVQGLVPGLRAAIVQSCLLGTHCGNLSNQEQ